MVTNNTPRIRSAGAWLAVATALLLVVSACGDDAQVDATTTTQAATSSGEGAPSQDSSQGEAPTAGDDDAGSEGGSTGDSGSTGGLVASDYLGSYELTDEVFGTMTTVTVSGGTRTIVTNALPDHETGEFPNDGNPNAITAQSLTWEFPTEPTFTGNATEVRTSGVAVNGVKFEPGTAETLTCSSGENYRIEALQEVYDLGLDFNNAHVQPTGEYHYHGVSQMLVDAYATGDDLVHIGFAPDGHLIYYSKSSAYASSYQLSSQARSGTNCEPSGPFSETIDVAGTTPDGTYTSDYQYIAGAGDLDECNGITVDGQYVYLLTNEYPFIGRCVMGDVSGVAGVAGGGGGGAPGQGTDTSGAPGGGGGEPPDLTEAAGTLGVSVAELEAALGSPPFDLPAAAAALGVSVEELQAALPPPPGG